MATGWVEAALAVGLGAGLLARWRRAEGRPWALGRWACRAGLVVACAVACLGLSVPRSGVGRSRAVVVDVSRSLARGRTQRADWVRQALADLDPDRDQAALILAGAEVRVSVARGPVSALLERLDRALALPLDERGTDLGQALRVAASEGVDEVFLISDGRDTAGELQAAAGELARAGVSLFALAPDLPRPYGVRLARLEAPVQAAPGERLPVRVEAQAFRPARVTVVLEVEDALGLREVGRVVRPAGPGAPLTVRFSVPPLPQPGLITIRARVSAVGRDDDPADDVLEVVCAVGDPPRVWRVGSAPPLAGVASRTLAPAALAAALGVEAPDLILLGDVSARELRPAAGALRAAVEAGTGLVVGGARQAFGPGGYAGSEFEALLPVTTGPAQDRQRALDMLVALDASGSMGAPDAGGRTRYQQAVASAVPVHLIRPGDRLGVVTFAGQPQLVQPLGPPPDGLLERLARRSPGGETDAGAALVLGLETLRGGAGDAFLVLATDSEDADPARHAAAIRALAQAFPPERLRVLLVLIGRAEETGSLRTLADAVGPAAALARADDADQALRELVAGELALRRNERREGRFALAATEAGAERGLALPESVSAFAPTQPRAEARVLGLVRDAETDDPPALALWSLGAGRVVAAPVEAASLGPVLGPLLVQLLPADREAVALRATRRGRGLEVTLDGAIPAGARVRVLGSDGSSLDAEPLPETPTLSRVRLPRVAQVTLQVVAVDALGQRLAAAAVADAGAAELEAVGPDPGALVAATRATGGSLLSGWPSPEHRVRGGPSGREARSLSPWLLALALALLLLEVGALALRERLALAASRAG